MGGKPHPKAVGVRCQNHARPANRADRRGQPAQTFPRHQPQRLRVTAMALMDVLRLMTLRAGGAADIDRRRYGEPGCRSRRRGGNRRNSRRAMPAADEDREGSVRRQRRKERTTQCRKAHSHRDNSPWLQFSLDFFNFAMVRSHSCLRFSRLGITRPAPARDGGWCRSNRH